jgi:hypothetical protein
MARGYGERRLSLGVLLSARKGRQLASSWMRSRVTKLVIVTRQPLFIAAEFSAVSADRELLVSMSDEGLQPAQKHQREQQDKNYGPCALKPTRLILVIGGLHSTNSLPGCS